MARAVRRNGALQQAKRVQPFIVRSARTAILWRRVTHRARTTGQAVPRIAARAFASPVGEALDIGGVAAAVRSDAAELDAVWVPRVAVRASAAVVNRHEGQYA